MSANRLRNNQLKFWLNDSEMNLFESLYLESGRKSQRQFLLELLQNTQIVVADMTVLHELNTELSRIGNNINQIARKANEHLFIYHREISELQSNTEAMKSTMALIYMDLIDYIHGRKTGDLHKDISDSTDCQNSN